jgi:hypothetical protein
MKRDPAIAFELRLDAAATPERVEQLARFYAALVREIGDGLPPQSITMVVDNFDTVCGMRPWNAEARERVNGVRDLIENPAKHVGNSSSAPRVLRLVSNFADGLGEVRATFRARNRVIADLGDQGYRDIVRTLSRPRAEKPIRSSTMKVSRVLMIGRKHNDSTRKTARVLLDGIECDLPFDPAIQSDLYAAAEHDLLQRLTIEGFWESVRGGFSALNLRKARIVAAETVEFGGATSLASVLEELGEPWAIDDLFDDARGDDA